MQAFILTLALLQSAPAPGSGLRMSGKQIDVAGAVVVGTTGPRAIHAGYDVFERGGSAVDAALTTALAQTTLCAGCWVSFAGRLTAVVFEAETGRVYALNACYDVPRGETDPLTIPRQPAPSGRTALVPGFMAGVGALHQRFGVLPLSAVFQPSIDLAREGFELTPNLARLIRNKREVLLRTEGGRAVFLAEDGELHVPGARFRQPDLADVLEATAEEGTGYFYTGEWAQHFVEAVRADDGRITLEDMAAYRPTWQETCTATLAGTTVHGLPLPNRGGPSSALALNLARELEFKGHGDPMLTVYGLRGIADIDRALAVVWSRAGRTALTEEAPAVKALWENAFAREGDAKALAEVMTSPVWKSILARTFGEPERDDHSDAIVAVDRRGNVVAMIHTINTAGWGTTGLFVDGVSIPDSGASQQAAMLQAGPGGRLSDHGVPLIGLRDGKPVFASSATGSGNVTASWQNAIRVLGFGLAPGEVADGPNLYSGRVEGSRHSPEQLRGVREGGVPLGTVERFGGFERGFWVGVTLDPETGQLSAATVSVLDGIAVGLGQSR